MGVGTRVAIKCTHAAIAIVAWQESTVIFKLNLLYLHIYIYLQSAPEHLKMAVHLKMAAR